MLTQLYQGKKGLIPLSCLCDKYEAGLAYIVKCQTISSKGTLPISVYSSKSIIKPVKTVECLLWLGEA